jgi:hypothetical protein
MSLPYCQLPISLATVLPAYPDRHLKLIFPSQATTPDIQLPRLSPQAQQSHKHNSHGQMTFAHLHPQRSGTLRSQSQLFL